MSKCHQNFLYTMEGREGEAKRHGKFEQFTEQTQQRRGDREAEGLCAARKIGRGLKILQRTHSHPVLDADVCDGPKGAERGDYPDVLFQPKSIDHGRSLGLPRDLPS
jgi:hypothetical protein